MSSIFIYSFAFLAFNKAFILDCSHLLWVKPHRQQVGYCLCLHVLERPNCRLFCDKMEGYSSKKAVRSFGGPDQTDGEFLITQSHHMACFGGKVHVSEMINHRVKIFDVSNGNLLKSFGELGCFDGEFNVPGGIALWNDNIVVCDVNNNRLQTFDNDGNFVSEFGSQGDGPGCFAKPASVCVDPESQTIFVGEAGNTRVQILDKDFNHKNFITGPPFKSCNHISYDGANKRIIVTDHEAEGIFFFDAETGQSVSSLAGEGQEFKGALKAIADKSGNVLVCEYGEKKVVAFDKDGKKVGQLAEGYDFKGPMDICINENGEVVLLEGDIFAGWNRVTVF